MYRESVHTTRFVEQARREELAAVYGRRDRTHLWRAAISRALVKFGARLSADPLRAPLGGGLRP